MHRNELIFEIETFLIREDINRRDYIVVGQSARVLNYTQTFCATVEILVRDHVFYRITKERNLDDSSDSVYIGDVALKMGRARFREITPILIEGLNVMECTL